jgi:DNA-binding NarL/FixJ family response regulator
MIKSGIYGFVLKEATTLELERAIRDVSSGLGYFSPELLQKAIIHVGEKNSAHKRIDNLNLSSREFEILGLVCKGLTNKEISGKLFLSSKTVESHKSSLFLKTNTHNTAGLVLYAVKNDLIRIT